MTDDRFELRFGSDGNRELVEASPNGGSLPAEWTVGDDGQLKISAPGSWVESATVVIENSDSGDSDALQVRNSTAEVFAVTTGLPDLNDYVLVGAPLKVGLPQAYIDGNFDVVQIASGFLLIRVSADGVLDTSLGAGVKFPSADPHVAGAWWDNAGVLTKSLG